MSEPFSGAQPRLQVPGLNLDPIASLCPWPVTVTVGSERFEIPALPAVDWLCVLMVEDLSLYDVVPGLFDSTDVPRFIDALSESDEDTQLLALDAIRVASGREWWVALRLLAAARAHWHVLGPQMLQHGADAERLSLSGWLDVLTVQFVACLRPENGTMALLQLEMVPEGFEPQEDTLEISEDQFLAMSD